MGPVQRVAATTRACSREDGNDADRGVGRHEVGEDAGGQCADGEAEVAPEALDADDAGAVARLGDV